MISYNKLWRMCVERDEVKYLLFAKLGLSSQTLYKMRQNKSVHLMTIDKLCTYFKCQPNEIMEIVNEEQGTSDKN